MFYGIVEQRFATGRWCRRCSTDLLHITSSVTQTTPAEETAPKTPHAPSLKGSGALVVGLPYIHHCNSLRLWSDVYIV